MLIGLPLAALLLAMVLASGCSKDSPTQPSSTTRPYLGLSANPDASDPPDSIYSALLTARATGATLDYLSLRWDEFSPTPGVYDVTNLRVPLEVVQSLGFDVYVNLATIDTNNDRRPPDIKGLAWDDARVIARMDTLVDTLIAIVRPTSAHPRALVALALGNEVDAYFASAHASEFPAFLALYRREVGRIHTALPGLKVGICTISPMGSPNPAFGDQLHGAGDLAIYTYYPFTPASDFQHQPPSMLPGDFDLMAARVPGKPYGLQEVGYSSSIGNGSSGTLQAQFVTRFRQRVASDSRDRLLFANWFLYSDFSSTLVNQLLGYYGGSSPGFIAYLSGLGLRDSVGTAKPSWAAWRAGP